MSDKPRHRSGSSRFSFRPKTKSVNLISSGSAPLVTVESRSNSRTRLDLSQGSATDLSAIGRTQQSSSSPDLTSKHQHMQDLQRVDIHKSLDALQYELPPMPNTPGWSKSVGSSVIKGMSKKEVQRQEVVQELIDTERCFVFYLYVLERFIKEALLRCSIITPPESEILFSELPQVIQQAERCCRQLETILDRAVAGVFGDVGEAVSAALQSIDAEPYAICSSNFAEAIKFHDTKLKAAAKYQKAFNAIYAHAIMKSNKLQFKDLLIKITQRIPRYALLVKTIEKHTSKSNTLELNHLKQASAVAKSLSVRLDGLIAEHDMRARLKDIQSRLDYSSCNSAEMKKFRDLDITCVPRQLVKDGSLDVSTSDATPCRELSVFLFTDFLMFIQQKGTNYVLKPPAKGIPPVIPLHSALIREDKSKMQRILLMSQSKPPFMLFLKALSKKENKKWLDELTTAADAAAATRRAPLLFPHQLGDEQKPASSAKISREHSQGSLPPAKSAKAASVGIELQNGSKLLGESMSDEHQPKRSSLRRSANTARKKDPTAWTKLDLTVPSTLDPSTQYFGAKFGPATGSIAGIHIPDGSQTVLAVALDSIADETGLQVNDIIIAINNVNVGFLCGDLASVNATLLSAQTLTILRYSRPFPSSPNDSLMSRRQVSPPRIAVPLLSAPEIHQFDKSPGVRGPMWLPDDHDGNGEAMGARVPSIETLTPSKTNSPLVSVAAATSQAAAVRPQPLPPPSPPRFSVEEAGEDGTHDGPPSMRSATVFGFQDLDEDTPMPPAGASLPDMPLPDPKLVQSHVTSNRRGTHFGFATPEPDADSQNNSVFSQEEVPEAGSEEADKPLHTAQQPVAFTPQPPGVTPTITLTPADAAVTSTPLRADMEPNATDVSPIAVEHDTQPKSPRALSPSPYGDGKDLSDGSDAESAQQTGLLSEAEETEESDFDEYDEEEEEEDEDVDPFDTHTSHHFSQTMESSPSNPIELIIDLGSISIRAGFAAGDGPCVVLPSLLSRPVVSNHLGSEENLLHIEQSRIEPYVFSGSSRPVPSEILYGESGRIGEQAWREELGQFDEHGKATPEELWHRFALVREILTSAPLDAAMPSDTNGVLALTLPLASRDINELYSDWDGLRVLLETVVSQLVPATAHCSILVVDHAVGVLSRLVHQRYMLADLIFSLSAANIVSVSFADQAYLSCLGMSRRCALVVHCGDAYTQIVPVIRGAANQLPEPLLYCSKSSEVAGSWVTGQLTTALKHYHDVLEANTGDVVASAKTAVFVRDIKEKCCFVSLDYASDLQACAQSSLNMTYTLPDNTQITLGRERFECMETLFDTDSPDSIPHLVAAAIAECPEQYRDELLNNVVLSGGTTMCKNFALRLKRELTTLVGRSVAFCTSDMEADILPWVGASVTMVQPHAADFLIARDTHTQALATYSDSPPLYSVYTGTLTDTSYRRGSFSGRKSSSASLGDSIASLPDEFQPAFRAREAPYTFDLLNLKGRCALTLSTSEEQRVDAIKLALTQLTSQMDHLATVKRHLEEELQLLDPVNQLLSQIHQEAPSYEPLLSMGTSQLSPVPADSSRSSINTTGASASTVPSASISTVDARAATAAVDTSSASTASVAAATVARRRTETEYSEDDVWASSFADASSVEHDRSINSVAAAPESVEPIQEDVAAPLPFTKRVHRSSVVQRIPSRTSSSTSTISLDNQSDVIATWTAQDVAKWLGSNDLYCVQQLFFRNGIAGEDLVDLCEADLVSMGVHDEDLIDEVLHSCSFLQRSTSV
eukprot:m.324279 g.324279  ORF g.324279 m.324279 type:complete len:1777 (-) comp16008_c0_seq11:2308-7638(-)